MGLNNIWLMFGIWLVSIRCVQMIIVKILISVFGSVHSDIYMSRLVVIVLKTVDYKQ